MLTLLAIVALLWTIFWLVRYAVDWSYATETSDSNAYCGTCGNALNLASAGNASGSSANRSSNQGSGSHASSGNASGGTASSGQSSHAHSTNSHTSSGNTSGSHPSPSYSASGHSVSDNASGSNASGSNTTAGRSSDGYRSGGQSTSGFTLSGQTSGGYATQGGYGSEGGYGTGSGYGSGTTTHTRPYVKPLFQAPVNEKDDLKVIKGIGEVMEGTLNDLGITTYRQLANFKQAEVKMVSDRINEDNAGFGDRIERDEWVEQAKRLV